jgi:hypothetical protein
LAIGGVLGIPFLVSLWTHHQANAERLALLSRPTARVSVVQVQALRDRGADVNATDENGGTALLAAAYAGNTECIRYLVSKGADVNAVVPNNVTPLMVACHLGDTDAAKYLISKGANVNAGTTDDGTTALITANEKPRIVAILKAAGAKEGHARCSDRNTTCP